MASVNKTIVCGNVIISMADFSTMRWVEGTGILITSQSGKDFSTGVTDYKKFEAWKDYFKKND